MEQLYFKKMVNCPLAGKYVENTRCVGCPLNDGKTETFVWCKFRNRVGLKDRSYL